MRTTSRAWDPPSSARSTLLVAQPDLIERGIPRVGNNVAFSRYLYFDGDLSILLYAVPKDQPIPPHDHGIWETLTVYRGRVRHVLYERVDDGDGAGCGGAAGPGRSHSRAR